MRTLTKTDIQRVLKMVVAYAVNGNTSQDAAMELRELQRDKAAIEEICRKLEEVA